MLFQTTDALRKNKANSNLCARITSRMLELRKSCTTTTPLTPETTATAMHTALEAVTDQLRPDIPSLKMGQPLKDLRGILAPYVEFLCVKAKRYFSLGSYPFYMRNGFIYLKQLYSVILYLVLYLWAVRALKILLTCIKISYQWIRL